MTRRPHAAGRHADFPRIGLGVGNELRDGLGRNRRMHQYDIRHPHDAGDRLDVTYEIKVEPLVERGVGGVRGKGQKESIAIRGRSDDRLSGDVSARARAVLDDKLLPKSLREPLTHQACNNIDAAPSGRAADDAHRARRIGLRPRDLRSACSIWRDSKRRPAPLRTVGRPPIPP